MAESQNQDILTVDDRNGKGYAQFLPAVGEPDPEAIGIDMTPATFDYADQLLRSADELEHSSLLIEGGPGSGKSHLAQDLFYEAVRQRRPSALWQLHIAAGKRAALPETAVRVIDPLIERSDEDPVLVIDNVDYLAYRSRRTSHAAIRERIEVLAPIIERVVEDEAITLLGLSHTLRWRQNNWQKADQESRDRSQQVLDAFQEKVIFEGNMTFENSVRHLVSEGVGPVHARILAVQIHEANGQLLFRHVHHAPRFLRGLRIPTLQTTRTILSRINEQTAQLESGSR